MAWLRSTGQELAVWNTLESPNPLFFLSWNCDYRAGILDVQWERDVRNRGYRDLTGDRMRRNHGSLSRNDEVTVSGELCNACTLG